MVCCRDAILHGYKCKLGYDVRWCQILLIGGICIAAAKSNTECSSDSQQDCVASASLLQRHRNVVAQAASVVDDLPAATAEDTVLERVQRVFEEAFVTHKAASEDLLRASKAEEANAEANSFKSALLQQSASTFATVDAKKAKEALGAASQRAQEAQHEAAKAEAEAKKANLAAAALTAMPNLSVLPVTQQAKAREAKNAADEARKLAAIKATEAKVAQEAVSEMKAKQDIGFATDAVERAADATSAAAMAVKGVTGGSASAMVGELSEGIKAMEEAAKEHEVASRKVSLANDAEADYTHMRRSSLGAERKGVAENSEAETVAEKSEAQDEFVVQEAAKVRLQADKAKEEAQEAQRAALEAQEAVQKAKGNEEICFWKMPTWCAPVFMYEDIEYGECVKDESYRPWCSHDATFTDAWSECSFTCEPRSRAEKSAQLLHVNSTHGQLPAAGPIGVPSGGASSDYLVPVYIPAASLQSGGDRQLSLGQVGTENRDLAAFDGVGATALLDETGYMEVAELTDTPEMAMFVRRAIARIGCLITDEQGLAGFMPWYSGEADVQSFAKLDSELRCLCTRAQGPQWLQAIDPNNPPQGGMGKCTGRRLTKHSHSGKK